MGTDGQRLVGGKAEVPSGIPLADGAAAPPCRMESSAYAGERWGGRKEAGKEEKEGKLGWRHPGPAHTYS
jgi:hypothetical protein